MATSVASNPQLASTPLGSTPSGESIGSPKSMKRISLSAMKWKRRNSSASKLTKKGSTSSVSSTSSFSSEDIAHEIDREEFDKNPFLLFFHQRVTFDAMRKHLKHEFNEENLEFVSEVLDYQALVSSEDRAELARKIFETYIKHRSSKQVNISSKMKKEIEDTVGLGLYPVELYEQAKNECIKMMKENSFPRFSTKVTTNVRDSWSLAQQKMSIDDIGITFYNNLFKLHPELKTLFTSNSPHAQASMFISMLANVVTICDDLQNLIPKLAALSIRHRAYGCNSGHFGPVGAIFLDTLKDILQEDWNDDIAESWGIAYTLISVVMQLYLPGEPLVDSKKLAQEEKCTLL